MPFPFELQGHRGARGLRPENTLPSFEAALDVGVSSIETDVHLSRDGVPVLYHDACLGSPPCTPLHPEAAPLAARPAVSNLALAELRGYRADQNPQPARFPNQSADVPPVAHLFAARHGLHPYAIPTLADLFAFVAAYADELGEQAGKTEAQRRRARALHFDLELKRVPFFPSAINDGFDGRSPGLLERRLLEEVRRAGVASRTRVRSFDHRCVRVLRDLEPRLSTAVLIAETAPVAPADLARQAGAEMYCPSYDFLDESLVREVHAAGVRVLPWTVNDPEEWNRLLDWGVDGICTDFPDRLAALLSARGIMVDGG
jgi:glycerophosphoryl diester phosphodiesterase